MSVTKIFYLLLTNIIIVKVYMFGFFLLNYTKRMNRFRLNLVRRIFTWTTSYPGIINGSCRITVKI